jgi:hypothetical protein
MRVAPCPGSALGGRDCDPVDNLCYGNPGGFVGSFCGPQPPIAALTRDAETAASKTRSSTPDQQQFSNLSVLRSARPVGWC